MKDWPTLGLGVLYDFFNARDGVVSEEPMYVDGILRRMAFNAEAEIRWVDTLKMLLMLEMKLMV